MTKRIGLLLVAISLFVGALHAQPSKKEYFKLLKQMELGIKGYANDMINADHWYKRFEADSFFIRGFVQALKVPYSYSYPFDSLKTVSRLYAPDSSFRIFTWQMMKDFTYYRQKGAIQMRTKDGSLKLYPLFDISSFTNLPNDSLRTVNNWIGAIYYKIIETKAGNQPVYTLLGFDANGPRSNKKWMDILTFNEEGAPQFGGTKYFKLQADTAKQKYFVARYSVEYKKEAKMRMLYDKEADLIVYDHLISENNEPENLYTYVPDGTYEAFKWKSDHWEHLNELPGGVALGDGNAPVENLLYDDNGNINQKKIEKLSRKNMALPTQEEDERKISNKKKKPQSSEEKVDY